MQPLDKVKDEIKTFLEQQKKVEALQKLFAGLKAEAKIEYVDKSFDPANIQNALRQKYSASRKYEPCSAIKLTNK